MAVHVVTDSTADLPLELAQALGLTVIPCNLHFGTQLLRDGVDIQSEEFFQRLTSSSTLPTTSQPSVGAFLELYDRLTQKGDAVVSVHLSSKLSGTVNSAIQARAQLPSRRRVEVVDTLLVSMGLGLAAMAAAQSAKEGAEAPRVADAALKCAAVTEVFFALDTLEYLAKGGRIGRAQALLGSLLSIKPILVIRDGEVHPLERPRTRGKALARLYELAQERAPFASAAVMHTTTPRDAEELGEKLRPLTGGQFIVSRIGPVIGTHTGPGVVGIALQRA